MLLVVDVGNTNIVAGVFEDKTLKVHWRFSTDRSKTADEFGIMLRSMFAYSDVEMDKISSVIISSVVPPVLIPLCHMCERYFGIKPMVVGPGVKTAFSLNTIIQRRLVQTVLSMLWQPSINSVIWADR